MSKSEEVDLNQIKDVFRDQLKRWDFQDQEIEKALPSLIKISEEDTGSESLNTPTLNYAHIIGALTAALISPLDINPSMARSLGSALWLWQSIRSTKARNVKTDASVSPSLENLVENKKYFLFLATEWAPHHGGLSMFNQNICIALAEKHNVSCYVGSATEQDIKHAKENNVTLILAAPLVGVPEKYRLLIKPDLNHKNSAPDYIVGHDRQTGPAAVYLNKQFNGAKLILFCHTAPQLIEWHKGERNQPEVIGKLARQRAHDQEELFRSSDYVVAVGPTLTREVNHLLRPEKKNYTETKVLPFIPGFLMRERSTISKPDNSLLFIGRAEDASLKGLDIIDSAIDILKHNYADGIRWTLLGADARSEYFLKKTYSNLTNVIAYDPSRETLSEELARSDILWMPSREEGFGLVAAEAIEHNRPFIVSKTSGFAQFLLNVKDDFEDSYRSDIIDYFIVDLDKNNTGEELAEKLGKILENWDRANELLIHMREKLAIFSWSYSTNMLLEQLEI